MFRKFVLSCQLNIIDPSESYYSSFCINWIFNVAHHVFCQGAELVGERYRVLTASCFQVAYSFGYTILAGLAYLIQDWRYIEGAISVPVILFSVYIWWVSISSMQ